MPDTALPDTALPDTALPDTVTSPLLKGDSAEDMRSLVAGLDSLQSDTAHRR
jgi:NitT/TauT family transport system permease protein